MRRKNLPFELGEMNEDCLTLNVWTPDTGEDAKLPVMVWIHGGGYLQGSGNIPRLNSPAMAQQGVVLVTVNYRLNVFGFFAHPALSKAQGDELLGNYGLMDVVASLEWVQRNIAAFGGDPDNVTVFGESAGAGLINYLMVMPRAKGLFHQAITQSSAVGLAPNPHITRPMGFNEAAEKKGLAFAEGAGVAGSDNIVSALRGLSTEAVLEALDPRVVFGPMIEGDLIPDQVGLLFAQGKQHDVPVLTGGNSWEASLGRTIGGNFSPDFMSQLVPPEDKARLYPGMEGAELADIVWGDLVILTGARYLADQMKALSSPTYHYYLSYVAESRRDTQPGAAHTDDIAFVMQTLDVDLDKVSERDREVSRLMNAYWVQFAKTGNPNREGLPEWPVYSKDTGRVLEIGEKIVSHDAFLKERIYYHMERGLRLLESVKEMEGTRSEGKPE
jgi:para-nitrobenzyl esterase